MQLQNNNQFYIDFFNSYTKPYLTTEPDPSMLRIKIEHTFKVYEHAKALCAFMPPHLHTSLQAAALFHDIGRFEQIRIWHTFSDSQSYNHARLSLRVLKENNVLASEALKIRNTIQAAVLFHNRYSLPSALPEDIKLVTFALRDADKLDILRVMVENLEAVTADKDAVVMNVKEEPFWSEPILNAIMQGKIARYSDMNYVNDFRLLLGTWLHEIHFPYTKQVIAKSDYFTVILNALPKVKELEPAKKIISDLLHDYK